MEIEAWLQGLGIERYAPAFRDNEIVWEVLPKLTSEDLREIGVAAVGHRRKLLGAIAALSASAPAAAVTAAVSGASVPTGTERPQLTVMFCDLVDSTPLSARASIPRICARSWPPSIAASPIRWAALPALSRNTWATACSFISAIPRRTKMMPSVQYAPASRSSRRSAGSRRRSG